MEFTGKKAAAYGLGAVGKDMVYALSSGYVMYYYQDILGLSASFVGTILMVARVFDAINDPFMGLLVAKTNTKWGKFRPWLLSGTVLNAFVLYALFAAPDLEGAGLMVYFAVIYILWGVTYTMMDIPYWSMIPAVTDTVSAREKLSVVGRTCAGVGNALITVFTVMSVAALGSGIERTGFKRFALIIAVVFVITEVICCLAIKEKKSEKMHAATIKEMFASLFHNDQAMVTVITIVLINTALYITSNFIIYFFKYDLGGGSPDWQGSYTLFSMVGGASQILGMMIVYPLIHKKLSNTSIFKLCLGVAIGGYLFLLILCIVGLSNNLILLLIPGVLIFMGNGILTVLTTVFLAGSVNYGEIKTGVREESVIFSMQTFVVKLGSGLAVFLTGIGLDLIGMQGNSDTEGEIVMQSQETLNGLHYLMTIIPIIGLIVATTVFVKFFKLTDEKAEEISRTLKEKHAAELENNN
ncbi:MAG: MFS transporter [Firmicutes bacterium]|nr:MFS transporter [Bacillota bacterium]